MVTRVIFVHAADSDQVPPRGRLCTTVHITSVDVIHFRFAFYVERSGTLDGVTTYVLLDGDGRPYQPHTPGTLGGHRRTKVYGRLDCPTALRWLAQGSYVQHRVFFADEEVAIAAGYRPCGHCLRPKYRRWLADVDARTSAATDRHPTPASSVG